jgi:hypothetical protein
MNHISVLSRDIPSNYCIELFDALIESDKVLIKDNLSYSKQICIDNHCHGMTETIKGPCSWDKAFLDIFLNNKIKYEYFYFIEDDVFSKDPSIFNQLISKLNNISVDLVSKNIVSKEKDSRWCFWPKYQKTKFFNEFNLARSFNPFCRLSKRLILKILEFQIKHNTFLFHEVLFATLCKENDFTFLDFSDPNNTDIFNFFGTFIYRPVINKISIQDTKIYHPVKR